jgi:hypothetical protein
MTTSLTPTTEPTLITLSAPATFGGRSFNAVRLTCLKGVPNKTDGYLFDALQITPASEGQSFDGKATVLPEQIEHVGQFWFADSNPQEANFERALAAYVPEAPPINQQAIYDEKLVLGYVDTQTGIRLKTTQSAQNKFTSQVTLISLALSKNVMTQATPVQFWDFNDEEKVLTVSDFLSLMLRYGSFCSNLYSVFAP